MMLSRAFDLVLRRASPRVTGPAVPHAAHPYGTNMPS